MIASTQFSEVDFTTAPRTMNDFAGAEKKFRKFSPTSSDFIKRK